MDFFGDFHRDTDVAAHTLSFLEDLLWTPEFIGSQWEGNLTVPALIPGVGLLSNYHSGYSNVNFLQAAVLKREPMVGNHDDNAFPPSGKAHLARGAITPYYNATMQAVEDIPAGMELFADFGGKKKGLASAP